MAKQERLPLQVLDVPQLVNSRILMGEFRGHDLRVEIHSRLIALPPTDALLVNMLHALSLDYYFAEHAFAPLFTEQELMASGKRVLFAVPTPSRNAFFEGILRSLGRATQSYIGCQNAFVDATQYCKVIGAEHGPIDFVGELSDTHARVLHVVNDLRNGTVETIGGSLNTMETEDVLDALRALADKGFILSRQVEGHRFYDSFYRFLSELENPSDSSH